MSWHDEWLAQASADTGLKPSEIETLTAQWHDAKVDHGRGPRVFDRHTVQGLERRGLAVCKWHDGGRSASMTLTQRGEHVAGELSSAESSYRADRKAAWKPNPAYKAWLSSVEQAMLREFDDDSEETKL